MVSKRSAATGGGRGSKRDATTDGARSRPIPLHSRLPNAPPRFIGRAAEAARLAEAIRRGPVSVVCGDGGTGKTALVLHTLHRSFARTAARTLRLALREGDDGGHLAREVLRVLTAATSGADVDWRAVRDEPEALLATIIDLAESGRWWLVLEDVHHARDDAAGALLRAARDYARASRWIVTSRTALPLADAGGLSIALSPMPARDLALLARDVCPHASEGEVTAAVAAAEGSPWRVQQCIVAATAGLDPTQPTMLAGLDADTQAFLRALYVVDVAVPAVVLERIAPAPTPGVLAALVRRGVIERVGGGLRLHDTLRPLLAPDALAAPDAALRRHAAGVLAANDDPVLVLEGLRLLFAAGAIDAATTVLDARGEALVVAGYAPRLARLLSAQPPRVAQHWRLRSATEVGDARALATLQPPDTGSPADSLLWAEVLVERGQLRDAARVAAEVAQRAGAAGASDVAFEAVVLQARCAGNSGAYDEALAALHAATPPTPNATARRDALAAQCLMLAGRAAEALALAARVEPPPTLPASQRAIVVHALASVYFDAGELRRAAAVGAPLASQPGGAFLRHTRVGRSVLFLRAASAAVMGELEPAREGFARLAPYWQASASWGPRLALARAYVRIAAGEFAGLDRELADLAASAARAGRLGMAHEAAARWTQVRTLYGATPSTPPFEATEARGETYFGSVLALHRAQWRVRHGDATPVDPAAYRAAADLGALVQVVAAEAALVAGAHDTAVGLARAAAEVSARHDRGVERAAALQAWAEALLAADDRPGCATVARALRDLAGTMGSPRFALEAELLEALATNAAVDPALPSRLSVASDVAPVAARRARALSGLSVALDALDRVVLNAVERRGATVLERVGAPASEPSEAHAGGHWGLDDARREVWLPSGKRVEFRSRPLLWRILDVLVDHGGSATKEQIVCGAWEKRGYHPLHDDNRLQVAVRKLRSLVEDDASKPARVLTTPDGYELARGMFRRRAHGHGEPQPAPRTKRD